MAEYFFYRFFMISLARNVSCLITSWMLDMCVVVVDEVLHFVCTMKTFIVPGHLSFFGGRAAALPYYRIRFGNKH